MNLRFDSSALGESTRMKSAVPVVVFADAGETLLPMHTIGREAADLNDLLGREEVSLVLYSSMTRAELEICLQALGIRQPFICESGAAVLVPHGYFARDVPRDRDRSGYHVIEFGRPYSHVVEALRRTSQRVHIPVVGFNDLSVQEVASDCGLSLSQARLAKLREYDEPFRLVHTTRDAHDRLWRALHAAGLRRTHAGVYEHVGAPVDYSLCIDALTALYRRASGACVMVRIANPPDSSDEFPAEWIDTILERAHRARAQRGIFHLGP